jgi:predicted PurR-regulated permease PerM
MPQVPVSVWEQIAVVIVFAFLLAGLGLILVKVFAKAISEINAHYAKIVDSTNEKWQKYFDARSETNQMVNAQVISQLAGLTKAVEKLASDLEAHDQRSRPEEPYRRNSRRKPS